MPTSRRDFLRSATTLTAASSLASLPPLIQQALAVEANHVTGTIRDVEHIVILMQENRSFDHYFGTLKGVRGFGDRFPIPLESGKPVWFESDGQRDITPFHLDQDTMNALKANTTSHEIADTQAAWNQGKFGYWPKYKLDMRTRQTTGHSMGYYTRAEIPFQFALADAFTLCDNYHCSVASGTDPNRIFFFSGANYDPKRCAQGLNHTPENSEPNNLRCWVTGQWPDPGYAYLGEGFDWPTLPELLQDAGVSWRIYQDPNNNWTGAMHGCLAFNSFRQAQKGSPLYEQGMSHWTLADLAQQVKDETLPQVSWILPSQADCEHAEGSSPLSGADFTAQVLAALVANPKVWSKTALFITFDENDGYFDHLPPPAVPSYNPDGSLAGDATLDVRGHYFEAPGFEPYRDLLRERMLKLMNIDMPPLNQYLDPRDSEHGLVRPYGMGPRVPMYVVSPWSRGGWVSSQVFDHSSVGRFLEQRFGITVPAISPWNRAVAGDLTSAFDFVSPNDPSLPPLPNTRERLTLEKTQLTMPAAAAPDPLPAFAQEPGTRPSRPTGYALQVHDRVDEAGNVTLQFVNDGAVGAVFHVYDHRHLDRIPRRYTVEAGKSLTAAWSGDDGLYDLEVHSTNGFFRRFSGRSASVSHESVALQLRLSYAPATDTLKASIHNAGTGSARLEISANAYREDGPWPLNIAPGETTEQAWSLKDSGNWYDFTLSSDSYQRRVAGRMENGRDLISDPAMARG
ncbi:phosphocholine-specific phospholipase C [Parahaliea mediterranea]|uniref:phosphocholine-specific phospholipase C n=1 Tax=Parahaliea mediterranea TaxID=651086 RepID=UPI000E2FE159|nr:phospholipase C, phosphocholine-specific [Parahaliea mediterranea]